MKKVSPKYAAAVKQVIKIEPLLYTPKLTLPIMPNIIKIFIRLPIWKKIALNNNDQLSFAKYLKVISSDVLITKSLFKSGIFIVFISFL